jgi:hypothetical protein
VFWRVNALRLPALDLFSGNVEHVEESTCRRRGLFGRLQAFEAPRPAGPLTWRFDAKVCSPFPRTTGRRGSGEPPLYGHTHQPVISGCVHRRIPLGRETCRAPYQHQAVNEPKVSRTARQFSAAGVFVRERFADSGMPAARNSP